MKKRIRRRDPEKQTYWEAVVRRWREGGQSVRAFCRAEELRESPSISGGASRRDVARGSPPAGSRCREWPLAAPQGTLWRMQPCFCPCMGAPASGEPGMAEAGHPRLRCRGVEIILAQGLAVRVQAGSTGRRLPTYWPAGGPAG